MAGGRRIVCQDKALHRPNLSNKSGAEDCTPSAPAASKHLAGRLLVRRLLAVSVALGGAGENLLGNQPGVLADRALDLGGDIRIGFQERLGVLAALAEPLA